MESKSVLQKTTGSLFILGAVAVNIPYTLLISNFNYPDILREPVGTILTRFHEGGVGLIWTWFAFAWTGLPILFGIVLLHKVLEREDRFYLSIGTFSGLVGGIVQIIGLLRWTFVVPILASLYANPSTDLSHKDSVTVIFYTIHQYGGVILGEHIGQIFTIIWMGIISFIMLRSEIFKPWLGWFGFVAGFIYLFAQTELFATVIPNFPVAGEAGLIGSSLWLVWMILLGIFLIRAK
ncbi:DUF4386 domain-containing protein [Leptospira sarikeiensis]|uniref:DUF4386 domain-containing protein n=1 Tax=Leptospira sarikeiensis TaxID=2484943 RepID=A0A4V3JRI7_9LEPT|nr:DUF4386 domain-containing protein [Leptospira sarikeiensis]TGL60442.1 DUF4386 domain-containing protein [Leptospira sarikeiensis]